MVGALQRVHRLAHMSDPDTPTACAAVDARALMMLGSACNNTDALSPANLTASYAVAKVGDGEPQAAASAPPANPAADAAQLPNFSPAPSMPGAYVDNNTGLLYMPSVLPGGGVPVHPHMPQRDMYAMAPTMAPAMTDALTLGAGTLPQPYGLAGATPCTAGMVAVSPNGETVAGVPTSIGTMMHGVPPASAACGDAAAQAAQATQAAAHGVAMHAFAGAVPSSGAMHHGALMQMQPHPQLMQMAHMGGMAPGMAPGMVMANMMAPHGAHGHAYMPMHLPAGGMPPRYLPVGPGGAPAGAMYAPAMGGMPVGGMPVSAGVGYHLPGGVVAYDPAALHAHLAAGGALPGMEGAGMPLRRKASKGKQGWTREEDSKIVQYVQLTGQKWAVIAALLPGRTDDAVRNRYLRLQKKKMGDDAGENGAGGSSSGIPGIITNDDLVECESVKKGDMWTAEEDAQILEAVMRFGQKCAHDTHVAPPRAPPCTPRP